MRPGTGIPNRVSSQPAPKERVDDGAALSTGENRMWNGTRQLGRCGGIR